MAEEKETKVEDLSAEAETETTNEVDVSKLSKDAQKVIELVEKMTVLELNDLVSVLEEKFGVAAAPMAVAGVAAAAEAEAEETKSAYDIELTSAGDNKLAVIKAVRTVDQNLGLVEAKGMVEKAPVVIAEGVKAEEAEAHKKTLEEAGATVTLK